MTERLAILGGFSDYDRALIKTQGSVNDLRAVHDAMKAKAESLFSPKTFSTAIRPPTRSPSTASRPASPAIRSSTGFERRRRCTNLAKLER